MSVYELELGCGSVRLELLNACARLDVVLRFPPIDGFVTVRDDELPLPRQGIEIRGDGVWVELVCETPGEHWTFGLEAFGLIVDDPDDEIGERVPVGFDLEWEGEGTPEGLVHGFVLVGAQRFEIEEPGRFSVGSGA